MSTTVNTAGSPLRSSVRPTECRSAAEYVIKRLREAEDPLRPRMLSQEYQCSSSHMQHVLADLADKAAVVRVSRGQYKLAKQYKGDGSELRNIGSSESGATTENRPRKSKNKNSSSAAETSETDEAGPSVGAGVLVVLGVLVLVFLLLDFLSETANSGTTQEESRR